MFLVGDTITLSDGNQYIVAANANINNNACYCLLSTNEKPSLKYCIEKFQDGKVYIKEITNKDTVKKLYPYFKKSIDEFLKNNPN